jgi:hypothetical protein
MIVNTLLFMNCYLSWDEERRSSFGGSRPIRATNNRTLDALGARLFDALGVFPTLGGMSGRLRDLPWPAPASGVGPEVNVAAGAEVRAVQAEKPLLPPIPSLRNMT